MNCSQPSADRRSTDLAVSNEVGGCFWWNKPCASARQLNVTTLNAMRSCSCTLRTILTSCFEHARPHASSVKAACLCTGSCVQIATFEQDRTPMERDYLERRLRQLSHLAQEALLKVSSVLSYRPWERGARQYVAPMVDTGNIEFVIFHVTYSYWTRFAILCNHSSSVQMCSESDTLYIKH